MATRVAPINSVNPATEEVLKTYEPYTAAEVEQAVAQAQEAFLEWRTRSLAERAVPMRKLAVLLRERSDDYARLATLEMGKPIREAKAELEKCAGGCEFYAENAARFLSEEPATTSARKSYVRFDPLGIVLAVMPWNFPFWQVIRFGAPAMMAGNAVVLKHASNVPGCALAIEEAVRDAGFPTGLLRTLLVVGGQVEPVIADERVRAVTLTGSSTTGAQIAAAAGRMLKKTVLELGPRLRDRLSHLEGDEATVTIGALAQQRSQPAHRDGAISDPSFAPRYERVLRVVERAVDLLGRERIEPSEDLLGRRVDARDRRKGRAHRQIEDSPARCS